MSLFSIINQSIPEIRSTLSKYLAELKETNIKDTYLIKFTSTTDVNNPDVNHLRGLLFNHETKQIYSLTYPVPIEMKDLTQEQQQRIIKDITQSPYQVQEALDGTLLRLSHIDQKWVLSTNGKVDAHQAFWMNGVSFGNQFWSAQPNINTDNLNKEYVYLFLLCHPLNVIVINHTEPKVYHVATYDRNTQKEVECDIGLLKPVSLQMTVENVLKLITEATDKPVTSAGYMVVQNSDKEGIVKRYRFENINYTKARELRGDSNNTNFHLLVLMLDENKSKLNEFLEYYPIYKVDVNKLNQRINALSSKFYREYGLRYKSRVEIFINPRHHKFLTEIHKNLYLSKLKPQGKTVQHQDITDYLLAQPPAKLLYLLNYIHDMIGDH